MTQPLKISRVYLDLGGVFFTKGTEAMTNRLHSMLKKPKRTIDEVFKSKYRKEAYHLSRGEISTEEFWQKASHKLGFNQNDIPIIRDMWYGSYVPQEGMIHILQQLKSRVTLIACSGNTRERFEWLTNRYNLRELFDELFLSYQIGAHKVNEQFYKEMKKHAGSELTTSLFVDDNAKNTSQAQHIGFRTHTFTTPNAFESFLINFTVLQSTYHK